MYRCFTPTDVLYGQVFYRNRCFIGKVSYVKGVRCFMDNKLI